MSQKEMFRHAGVMRPILTFSGGYALTFRKEEHLLLITVQLDVLSVRLRLYGCFISPQGPLM
jgi:hypothetical protein